MTRSEPQERVPTTPADDVTPAKPAKAGYYEHLDGMRGLAAVVVALLHVSWESHLTDNAFIRYGAIFVDFFFVLSGIVISHAYPHIESFAGLRRFMRRRVARLYPLHLATLVAMGLTLAAVRAAAPSLWAKIGGMAQMQHMLQKFALNLAMLHAHGLTDSTSFNVPSWSIAAEMTAYLTYALVCMVAFRQRHFVFGLFTVLGCIILIRGGLDLTDYTQDLGFLRAVMSFSLGCLTYALWRRRDPAPTHGAVLLVASVGVILLVEFHALLPTAASMFIPLAFAALFYLFMRPTPGVLAFFQRPMLRTVGRLSYSIYMLHFLVRWVFGAILLVAFRAQSGKRVPIPKTLGDVLVLAYLAAILVASWASYKYLEDPARKRLQ